MKRFSILFVFLGIVTNYVQGLPAASYVGVFLLNKPPSPVCKFTEDASTSVAEDLVGQRCGTEQDPCFAHIKDLNPEFCGCLLHLTIFLPSTGTDYVTVKMFVKPILDLNTVTLPTTPLLAHGEVAEFEAVKDASLDLNILIDHRFLAGRVLACPTPNIPNLFIPASMTYDNCGDGVSPANGPGGGTNLANASQCTQTLADSLEFEGSTCPETLKAASRHRYYGMWERANHASCPTFAKLVEVDSSSTVTCEKPFGGITLNAELGYCGRSVNDACPIAMRGHVETICRQCKVITFSFPACPPYSQMCKDARFDIYARVVNAIETTDDYLTHDFDVPMKAISQAMDRRFHTICKQTKMNFYRELVEYRPAAATALKYTDAKLDEEGFLGNLTEPLNPHFFGYSDDCPKNFTSVNATWTVGDQFLDVAGSDYQWLVNVSDCPDVCPAS